MVQSKQYNNCVLWYRQSKSGSLADANSDIDAIFGIHEDDDPLEESKATTDSNSSRSYTRHLQDMFMLFVEIGHPERGYSIPAHLGTYIVDDGVHVEKTRKLCKFWERWPDLAKRY